MHKFNSIFKIIKTSMLGSFILLTFIGCGSQPNVQVTKNIDLFDNEFMFKVKTKLLNIPQYHNKLVQSKAIIVFPEITKYSFAYGYESGDGVLFKIIDGQLSNPIFVTLKSGSIGYSFGYSSRTDIIFINNDDYLVNILDNGVVETDFTATSASGSAGGSVGDSGKDFEILSKNNSGLIFAADFKTYSITPDEEKNKFFYKIETVNIVKYTQLTNIKLNAKYQFINSAESFPENTIVASQFDSDLNTKIDNLQAKKVNEKNWIIAIGIEKYDETDSVLYSKNSTEHFVKLAQKVFGVSSRNSYVFVDEKATSGSIKDKLELMLTNVKDGDTIYFYYSGHGIPVLPDSEPYILPKDKMPEMIGKDSFFKLSNIYKSLSDSKANKVVAFVDSCFSGATDGVSVVKGIAATRIIPKKIEFDKSKMVVLTAGKDKQYSNMYKEKEHRLFSYYLMNSLLKGKNNIEDIYREVYTNVKDESYKMGDLKIQEPQMEGNSKIEL